MKIQLTNITGSTSGRECPEWQPELQVLISYIEDKTEIVQTYES